ncbi:MAG TPA: hypothetical protein DHV96_00590 [Lachnospiraceae bacterium]|nr:hypothetical protein [Lachnospiraceae bacterium]
MKFRYFLRGVGIGIVFATIIFSVAYRQSGNSKMTDQQVIERAKKLGMVEPSTSIKDLLDHNSSKTETETASDSKTETLQVKEEDTTTEATTEAATEVTSEENTEQPVETVEITVARGSASDTVCQQLKDAGMIEDASEFDKYLIDNGYASRIRVGTHTLTKGMDFHAIAEAISDPL